MVRFIYGGTLSTIKELKGEHLPPCLHLHRIKKLNFPELEQRLNILNKMFQVLVSGVLDTVRPTLLLTEVNPKLMLQKSQIQIN